MTAVKVGDRVRATCEESVIIGTVTILHADSVEIMPDGYTRSNNFNLGGWTVEVLPPPIPDVVGTIVRDKDGDAWQRRKDAWYLADEDDTAYSLDRLQYFGPLTVLWTPEVGASHVYTEKDDAGPFPACDICDKQPRDHE